MDKTTLSIIERRRQRAAQIVESALAGLAKEMGLEQPRCIWNLDQGWSHSGPHRLDVAIDDISTKAYFSDGVLLAFHDPRADPGRRLHLQRILNGLQTAALC